MSTPISPPHYQKHPSGIECIEVTRHMNFNLGNVVKYLWRAEHKDAHLQDLKKAAWYLADEIRRLEYIATAANIDRVVLKNACTCNLTTYEVGSGGPVSPYGCIIHPRGAK